MISPVRLMDAIKDILYQAAVFYLGKCSKAILLQCESVLEVKWLAPHTHTNKSPINEQGLTQARKICTGACTIAYK